MPFGSPDTPLMSPSREKDDHIGQPSWRIEIEQGIARVINSPGMHRYIGEFQGLQLYPTGFDPIADTRPIRQFGCESLFPSHTNPLHARAQLLFIANAAPKETCMRRLMHDGACDLLSHRLFVQNKPSVDLTSSG